MIHTAVDGREFVFLFSPVLDDERVHIGTPSPRYHGKFRWLCCDADSSGLMVTDLGTEGYSHPVCARCARKAQALGLIDSGRPQRQEKGVPA